MVSKESILTGAMIMLVTYTLGLSLVSQAFPAGQTTRTLSSTGTIQIQATAGIGVYSDAQGTTPLTSLQWGTLQPGGTKILTFYIKNDGSTSTTLSLETSNWNPTAAENYIGLGWNYNGAPINPDAVVQITLTLSVASNVEGITTFGFDIIIVGSN